MPTTLLSPRTQDDRQIRQRATEALRERGYACLEEIECHATEGTILLTGTVPSFYMKQVAQQSVLNLPAVEDVVNRLEVEA